MELWLSDVGHGHVLIQVWALSSILSGAVEIPRARPYTAGTEFYVRYATELFLLECTRSSHSHRN